MNRILIAFPLMLFLSACIPSNTIQRSTLASMSPQMNIAEVKNKLKGTAPSGAIDINKNNRKYYVERYQLQIGTTQQTHMQCIPIGTSGAVSCYPVTTTVPVTEPYYLIYRGDKTSGKLLTWDSAKKLATSQNKEAAGLQQLIHQTFVQKRKAQEAKEEQERQDRL